MILFSWKMRLVYFGAIVLCIAFGLGSRMYQEFLPVFLAEHAGDVLWAMMVYFGLRFILVQKDVHVALFVGFLFCFAIEFSQLYQADWLNDIRGTVLGGLILGKGFLFIDFIRYTSGLLIAIIIDKVTLHKETK